MIWAKEETLPRSEIEKIQLARLKETVSYIYEKVEPYRRKMDEAQVKPDDIQSLSDLKKMPFTYKADFRDNYPTGLFAVEKKDLVRFHASSGTTGKPTVVGYTKKDLDNWLNNVARIACMGGATPDDVAQIAFGYGTFTGALGLHGGLEKLGAAVIPMSSGNTKKQIMFMQDVGTTLLVATPSYALHLGEEIRARGLDPEKDLKVHIGLFGGEGFIMQKISGHGLAFLEFDGSVIEYVLQPGQQIVVDTGYLAAMEATCNMEIRTVPGIKNMMFGGEGLFNTVITGPGRVWLQTMPISNVAGAIMKVFPAR